MSLYGALRSGVYALQAQSRAMAMVSNNISNLNTKGFKRSEASFSTLVSGASTESNFSGGSVISRPNLKATAMGQITKSTSETDLSVNGQGFFAVAKASDTAFNATTGKWQNNGEVLYTRRGDFTKNKNGLLENTSGHILLAWPRNAVDSGYDQTNLPGQLAPVTISDTTGTPKATTSININANLSSDKNQSNSFSATVDVFDLQGTSHVMKVNFVRSKTVARAYDVSVEMLNTKATVVTAYNNTNDAATKSTLMSSLHTVKNGIQKVYMQYDTPLKSMTTAELAALRSSMKIQYQDATGATKTVMVEKVAIDGGRLELDLNEVLPTDGADGTKNYSNLRVIYNNTKAGANALQGTVVDANGVITTPVTYHNVAGLGYDITSPGATTVSSPYTTMPPTVGSIVFSGGNASQVVSVTPAIPPATGGTFESRSVTATLSSTPATYTSDNPIVNGDIITVADPKNSNQLLYREVFNVISSGSGGTYEYREVAVTPQSPLASSISLGQIRFAEDGTIAAGSIIPAGTGVNKISSLNPTSNGFNLKVDFAGNGVTTNTNGKSDDVTSNLNFVAQSGNTGMTSYSSPHAIYSITQNGSTAGSFKSVQVNTVGEVEAAFSVGDNRKLAQIPVVMFSNANSLSQVNGNAFRATNNSGTVIIRSPGSAGAGLISSATLEASNVDLATEFSNMIITQRAYSAATKTVTTFDEMLEELVRAKR